MDRHWQVGASQHAFHGDVPHAKTTGARGSARSEPCRYGAGSRRRVRVRLASSHLGRFQTRWIVGADAFLLSNLATPDDRRRWPQFARGANGLRVAQRHRLCRRHLSGPGNGKRPALSNEAALRIFNGRRSACGTERHIADGRSICRLSNRTRPGHALRSLRRRGDLLIVPHMDHGNLVRIDPLPALDVIQNLGGG